MHTMMFNRQAVRVLERDTLKGESTVQFLSTGKVSVVSSEALYEVSEPGQTRVTEPAPPEKPKREPVSRAPIGVLVIR